jgi:hypothetical protein
MIEENQGGAYRPAWWQGAAFVFLEGLRAAADKQPGGLLGKTKFLTDLPNILGLQETLAACLQPIQHTV